MSRLVLSTAGAVLGAVVTLTGAGVPPVTESLSVVPGADGRLQYRATARGDHIVDFSYAGYMGGGVALPFIPVMATVQPSGKDDTAAVQSALDDAAKHTTASHPGAVLLAQGVFHLSAPLTLRASGLVLRGSGSGDKGTTLELTGAPHVAITTGQHMAGSESEEETQESPSRPSPLAAPTTLTNVYVPSGTSAIAVVDAKDIHAGDTILLVRPVTPAWLAFLGMDKLVRNGKPETWVGASLSVERIVASVQANTLTLTVPLTDGFDPAYGGGTATKVFAIKPPARLRQVGVEDLRIVCPALHLQLSDPHFDGISFHGVEDSWMRGLRLEEVTNAVSVLADSRRITIENVQYQQKIPIESAAKPFVFSIAGTQVLVQHVSGTADQTFYYATQARMQGPNVLRDCVFHGNGHIQPHQRWSTGLLVENCQVPDGGIDLQSRGTMGSGHGWPIGWSVLWNNRAQSFVVQNPPGTLNWSIGNLGAEDTAPMPTTGGPKGPPLPQGRVESAGKPVKPDSLYAQQLKDRFATPHVAR